MNLIIDIGNSNTKLAIFANDECIHSEVHQKFGVANLRDIRNRFKISSTILSNSGLINKYVLDDLKTQGGFIHLDHHTKIPIVNQYGTPQTLGKDRIAAAVGAFKRFPSSCCLIIDMGSCITLDCLNSKGEFIGGNISPGIKMRLRAMHHFTANLPLVEPQYNEFLFAFTTETALQNGAVKGTFMEIDAFIKEVQHEYAYLVVILTGGDANYYENYTKNKIFVAPNLVMEGLNEILQYNALN